MDTANKATAIQDRTLAAATPGRGPPRPPALTEPSEVEYRTLVGDLAEWEVDEEQSSPGPTPPEEVGFEVLLRFSGSDAALLDDAVELLGTDYVRFAKATVLAAAVQVLRSAGRAPAAVDLVLRDRDGKIVLMEAKAPMTVAEAARRFGVKRDRLQRAAMEGRLPGHKVGEGRSHPWLVQAADVERFLHETRRGPKPRAGR